MSDEACKMVHFDRMVKELIDWKNKMPKNKKASLSLVEKGILKRKKMEEKKNLLEEAKTAEPVNREPIYARDLKVVCDSMLEVSRQSLSVPDFGNCSIFFNEFNILFIWPGFV